MNIIQRQANDFFKTKYDKYYVKHKEFIDNVRTELFEYKRISYKIQFITQIIKNVKIEYDLHLEECTDKNNCPLNRNNENILFFLQEELENYENKLSPNEFSKNEIKKMDLTLEKIVSDLQFLKLGQEMTYDDTMKEFEEMQDMYFLNKKTWQQLFVGKLANMVSGGIISETVSHKLVELIGDNYSKFISS